MSDQTSPKSLTDLFLTFTILALQGFGGVLVVAQNELVEKKRWLTKEEFIEEWALAQIMPGPNIVNLSLVLGGRYFGVAGAIASLAGLLIIPLVIVLLLSATYAHYNSHPAVSGALRGMGAVAAGLLIATGLRLSSSLKSNSLGIGLCVVVSLICFVCVAILRWPLAYLLLGLGGLTCILAYRKLKP